PLPSDLRSHDIHGIDDADYCGVNWRILHVLRQARAGTRYDQHALMEACADSINSHHVAARVRSVQIDWSNDEQLFSPQSLVFLRRDDCPEDARDDHPRACALTGIASSTLP